MGVLAVLQERADGDVPSCWVRLCKEKTETQGWHWAPFQYLGPYLMAIAGTTNQTAFWTPPLCSRGAQASTNIGYLLFLGHDSAMNSSCLPFPLET